MCDRERSISLQLAAEARFIPLVQQVVEQGAAVFGLGRDKALRLTLAAEEIVSHLAATPQDSPLDLTLSDGGWCVLADFSFEANPADMWAVNLAARETITAGESMEHLGLLLASRMADGFTVGLEGRIIHLRVRQDRDYPKAEPTPGQRFVPEGGLTVLPAPEPALVKEACVQALNLYPPHLVHEAFQRPGKVVDMIARKDMEMAAAVDGAGRLAGAIVWNSPSESGIRFSGPYVFADDPAVAGLLETHLLGAAARTNAVSLFSEFATPDVVEENFESLGALDFFRDDQDRTPLPVWFRHMGEDAGVAVWVHPAMRGFIEAAYDDMVLMRTLRETDVSGETLPERTVLSARLRPELKEAVLSAMVVGADMAEVVAHHLEILKADGYLNVFFHLDLAYGWQAAVGGVLMENGFVPKLVLPHGGRSDVVVFQHA